MNDFAFYQSLWKNQEMLGVFSRLPDGEYDATIVSAEPGETYSGESAVLWTLRALLPNGQEKLVRKISNLNNGIPYLKRDLFTLFGRFPEEIDQLPAWLPAAQDARVRLRITNHTQQRNGRTSNRLSFLSLLQPGPIPCPNADCKRLTDLPPR